jgi:hypothetical protein
MLSMVVTVSRGSGMSLFCCFFLESINQIKPNGQTLGILFFSTSPGG